LEDRAKLADIADSFKGEQLADEAGALVLPKHG
jgi:hypothetical protein